MKAWFSCLLLQEVFLGFLNIKASSLHPPSPFGILGLHSGPFGGLHSFCLTQTSLANCNDHFAGPERYRGGVVQALSWGRRVGVPKEGIRYKAERLLREEPTDLRGG